MRIWIAIAFLSSSSSYALLTGVTSWSVSVSGTDDQACGTQASPCKTIQYTLDNGAGSGDSLLLSAGTFFEHLTIPISVTITGAGAGATFIDGSDSGTVATIRGFPTVATVTMTDLTVQHGRTFTCGGGIRTGGSLTLMRATVSHNRAVLRDLLSGQGGGICNFGFLLLLSSTIAGNQASEAGGIYNVGLRAIMLASTLSGNNSGTFGGATENFGPMYLVNSTIAGNDAIYGGAIYNVGTVVSDNCTFSRNTGTDGAESSIHLTAPGSVLLKNTILAGNSADQNPDCANGIASQDYNLIGDTTGCNLSPQPHDLIGFLTGLEALAYRGGPTETMGLTPGSPAINAIPGGCSTSTGQPISNDQRGRPRDASCDIGAFEVQH